MFSSLSSLKVRNQVCWYSFATTVLSTVLMRFTQPTQEQTVLAASDREPLPIAATPVHMACCMPKLDGTSDATLAVRDRVCNELVLGERGELIFSTRPSLFGRIACRTIWFPSTIYHPATGVSLAYCYGVFETVPTTIKLKSKHHKSVVSASADDTIPWLTGTFYVEGSDNFGLGENSVFFSPMGRHLLR